MAISIFEDYGTTSGITLRVIATPMSASTKLPSAIVEVDGRQMSAADARALADRIYSAATRAETLSSWVGKIV